MRAPYDNEPIGLRDYFAAKAMQSLLVRGWVDDDRDQKPLPYTESGDDIGFHELAFDAYNAADAMLAVRKPPAPTRPVEQPEQAEPGKGDLCDE